MRKIARVSPLLAVLASYAKNEALRSFLGGDILQKVKGHGDLATVLVRWVRIGGGFGSAGAVPVSRYSLAIS